MIRSFGKITEFRQSVKLARHKGYGSVEYTGTTKIHGTNGSIVFNKDGIKCVQGKKRILTILEDNYRFKRFVNDFIVGSNFETEMAAKSKELGLDFIVYGEWCGPGLHKNMAINKLPDKVFVVFELVADSADINIASKHYPLEDYSRFNDLRVYSATQFKVWKKTVDFTSTESVQAFATYAAEQTALVGDQCPAGKFFDLAGIGEGIVWQANGANPELRFKSKDQRHSPTKVKTIVPLTEEQFERKTRYEDFCIATVTENRVRQAIQELGADQKSDIPNLLRWIIQDIRDEEQDLMLANDIFDSHGKSKGLNLGKLLAGRARELLLPILEEIN